MKLPLLMLLLLMALNSSARNYYVNAQTGKDENNGLSVHKPKKTLQQAASLTKPGDSVIVMNGTYTNECNECNVLNIIKGGNARNYVVYINYPGHHPVLKFNGWAGILVTNGASYVKIIGFEIVGNNASVTLAKALKQPYSCGNKKGKVDPRYNGNGIVIESLKRKHSHHIVIAKNVVHDCGGGGIGASQCDYITVEDNLVYNTSWYTIFGTSGISFYQFWNFNKAKEYHNFIRRNKCYNNRSYVPWIKMCKIYDGNGIIIDDFRNKQNGSKLGPYKNRTLIENNICWYNGGTGIHTFQSDYVDIINNTAYCNSKTEGFNPGQILSGVGNYNRIINNILVADSLSAINSNYQNTNLTYHNNLHYNLSNPNRSATVNSSTCINGKDPLFVRPGNSLNADFRLQSNSPAIHQANTTAHSYTDITGTRRARGHRADIGAYEYD